MPLTKAASRQLAWRMRAPWRRVFGRRTVRRTVQGVDLLLPWSHLLPDYAAAIPAYGQNLVELAAGLHDSRPDPLQVIDVGANIGDSALQITARTEAVVLCVEADPYWVRYLRENVGGHSNISVEAILLTAEDGAWDASTPVRAHGTTHFVQDADQLGALPAVSATALRSRHPELNALRLVKCDTDGFDAVLVPAVAQAWQDCAPVLFFEFDPELVRAADSGDPNEVWGKLASLGYSRLAIWDNLGDPMGQLDIGDAPQQALTLEPKPLALGYHFWDVAACHADDTEALAVFDRLVPLPFSPVPRANHGAGA